MLRVGLTGGLGSGKSTAAAMLRERGAHVLVADEIGRRLMEPGSAVHDSIAATFGPSVVLEDGTLDRAVLARLAFREGRAEELNAIVHPAVLAEQLRLTKDVAAADPAAVVVVESALLFETRHAGPGGWQERFDRVVLVTAPDEVKVRRFVDRSRGTEGMAADRAAEATRRLARQLPDEHKRRLADFVLNNEGTREALAVQVAALWPRLQAEATQRLSEPNRGRRQPEVNE